VQRDIIPQTGVFEGKFHDITSFQTMTIHQAALNSNACCFYMGGAHFKSQPSQ
jgi:hypothetical protein